MATPIRAIYYTDPLCAWCYAAEPMLDAVQAHFLDRIEIQYKMFPLFQDVREVMNDPSRLWTIADRYRIVSKKTGVPINAGVWEYDSPQSAWPACEAVKAAERQEAGALFLRQMRVAVMVEGRNIARPVVQTECAEAVGLNLARFEKDRRDPARRDEVQADVDDAHRENVLSRPHFILTNTQDDRVAIAGPRSVTLFKEAVEALYHEQPEP